jgi:hypothetical protein
MWYLEFTKDKYLYYYTQQGYARYALERYFPFHPSSLSKSKSLVRLTKIDDEHHPVSLPFCYRLC